MDAREIATENRLAHWSGIMRERQESGMSIKSFCKASGFSTNTYHYWQKKLRETDCRELARQTEAPEKASAPIGWAELTIGDNAEVKPESSIITIEAGKFKIRVEEEFNAETLKKICETLVTLC